MFDRYYSGLEDRVYTSCPSSIDITINRAPTDKSVELLKEMQEKTIKSIVAELRVQDNIFNGIMTVFDLDYVRMQYVVYYKFKINGKDFEIKETIDKVELCYNDKDALLKKFFKTISETLTIQLLTHALSTNHEFGRILNDRK
jgi:hypothetical protein